MRENRYDSDNIVRRESLMLAAGLKFAVYRVRYPDGEPDRESSWSRPQFHMTYMPQDEIAGRTMVDDAKVVICGMLDEAIAVDFEAFVNKVVKVGHELISHNLPLYQATETGLFIAYQVRADDPRIEFQIRRGTQVLGIMGLEMAKLFVQMVRSYLDGPEKKGE